MKYADVTRILSDVEKLLRCIKCSSQMLLLELNTENFMKVNEKISLHLVCPKCNSKHVFEMLSPRVWGLVKVE